MSDGAVITLSGGVGGAKLALGLSHVVDADKLVLVANTADDFSHLGLRICPDIDTLLYTLSGLANTTLGWGRQGETWNFMKALRELGGETWFNLGDADLAMHVLRTQRLASGETLSQITADFATRMGISATVLPMCDEPVSTMVSTEAGELSFQHYFVREQCAPVVTGFDFDGIAQAGINPLLRRFLNERARAIVLAPSNPFVSIAPILAIPGMEQALRTCGAPVVAVSPIVGGKALKGPAAKMMHELDLPVSAEQVARRYQGFADAIVIDEIDAEMADDIRELGLEVCIAQTVMKSLEDRIVLAQTVMDFVSAWDRGARR